MRAFIVMALVACGSDPSPERKGLSVTAVDDAAAFVVWRDRSTQHWVSLVTRTGAVQWSRRLQGKTFPTSGHRLVAKDRFIVRTFVYERLDADARVQIETFSVDGSGWTAPLGMTTGQSDDVFYPGHAVGRELHQVFGPGLVTLDLDTGAEIRRVNTPFEPLELRSAANGALMLKHDSAVASVSSDGVVRSQGDFASGCFFQSRYWRLVADSGQHAVVTDDARVPLDATGDDMRLKRCARYETDYVLHIQVARLGKQWDEIWIARPEGHVRARIELGRVDESYDVFARAETLPRFVPVPRRSHKPDDEELVMIDLERGAVTWRVPGKDMTFASLAFIDGRWYYARNLWRHLLVLDGMTGRLITAVSLSQWFDTVAHSVSEQGVWLVNDDWSSDKPLATKLDPITLKPVVGQKIEWTNIRDRTEYARIPRN